jgi:pimeloyl-ACP methyl ester carboxylesterase
VAEAAFQDPCGGRGSRRLPTSRDCGSSGATWTPLSHTSESPVARPFASLDGDTTDGYALLRRLDCRAGGGVERLCSLPTVRLVRANGLEIGYERGGEGPPLVLVHGAAEDGRIWQPQLEALADEFTVVAWDEPGAGRSSDVPTGFGLADYANCLAALIEALALGPAHIAGLSWGGTVAMELYRHHPQLVASLILADTYAGWKGSLPEEEVGARVAGVRRMLAATAGEFDPTLPGLFAGDPPAKFVPLLTDIAATVRPASLAAQLFVMAEADQRDLLPRIAVPTLLIWGELDVRSPLSVAHQFEQAIPDAKLVVIPGTGHVSNLEQPDQFNAVLREFCRAHSPPLN